MASCSIQTTCFAISIVFYPDRKEEMIAYVEAATGVGLISGPLFGSILYTIGGYEFTFYCFGSLFLMFACFVFKIFDKNVDLRK